MNRYGTISRNLLGFIFIAVLLVQLPSNASAAGKYGKWIKDTNIYELFVRKFTPEGNLKGVEKHLQDLKDMGVKTIWLMPTFDSPSLHGYDVTDYESVNPDYGKFKDMKKLVDKAHSLNIKVLLDLPINHCSSKHPFFPSADPEIRKDKWFVWSNKDEEWPQPWVDWDGKTKYPNTTWFKDPTDFKRGYYYAAFDKEMPDFNYNDPAARKEIVDYFSGVMKFWIDNYNIDGFRCDAARYIAENGCGKQKDQSQTHEVWEELRERLNSIDPNAVMIAEAPTETVKELLSYYDKGKEFNSAFHFGFQGMLLDCIKTGQRPASFFKELFGIQRKIPKKGPQECQDSLILANHDSFAGARVGTQLNGDIAMEKAVAALYILLSGNPVMYYGEEIGMLNTPGAKGDEAIRGPMSWDEYYKQKEDPDSLLAWYTKLLNLRNSYKALKGGKSMFIPVYYGVSTSELSKDLKSGASSPVVCIIRKSGAQMVLVAHNFSDDDTYYIFANLEKSSAEISKQSIVTLLLGTEGNYPSVTGKNMSNYPLGSIEPLGVKVLIFNEENKK
ncbi:MAG TPA: hypothetical protein DD381_12880 [Lentisphaeria bacterium]|nr:MAG: hypothetical protein A2X47_12450 [Lentisphaerae bacterium GWF2_38_69]HBM17218.1 hypothetical protein [Lentisphaeria bacterium]